MKDFRRLSVWHKAHAIVLDVYSVTKTFPADERYGLTSQIRRGGESIAANIAEGCGRGSDADLRRFLTMSMGSASELEYHVLLAADLKLLDQNVYNRLQGRITEVKKMLASLIGTLTQDQ